MYFGTRFINDIKETEISITSNGRFWIIALALIAIWTLFSGIGGGAYQTGDFKLRNAVFRDLCTYNYPVIYDMQKNLSLFRLFWEMRHLECVSIILHGGCLLLVSQDFLNYFHVNSSIAYGAASVSLYLWAVLGLFLTFYCLVRFFNKYSFWILSAFMLFSGLDFIAYLLQNMQLPINTHIEWIDGAKIFQYSSHTTQLYWVFNQSIPIWLISAVLLLVKNKRMGAWSSLAFAYSPFATIGLIPICLVAMLSEKGKRWKEKLNPQYLLRILQLL